MDLNHDDGFAGPIDVHVEELILDGIGTHGEPELVDGLKSALGRMLGQRGLATRILHGDVDVTSEPREAILPIDGTPSAWGEAIGGAVYEGLGR